MRKRRCRLHLGRTGGLVAPLLIVLLPAVALAQVREITVPLRLDHAFLREALLAQVYTDPDHTARVWDDGSGCNYLTLSDPRVETQGGRLHVVSAGSARAGTPIGDRCLVAFQWTGFVEAFEQPKVEPGIPVIGFRVVDSNVYGPDGRKRLATGTLWDWVKRYVHPRLEALRVDLRGPIAELSALLPLLLARKDTEAIRELLDSLSVASVSPEETGMTASLRLRARVQAAPAPAPAPPLTPEEIERWDAQWQRWDAFLAFVVKHAAGDTGASEVREALLGVLLDSRHDLLQALAPTTPKEQDPARSLFLKTWRRLAPALRQLSTGLPGEAALRYLTFVAAGDALKALDELGPDFGLEISSDGLRRLARILVPAVVEDPLYYSVAVDPDLRSLFGFGPPLEPPQYDAGTGASGWFVHAAWAEDDLSGAALRLNRWIPSPPELTDYLLLVRQLLNATAKRTLVRSELDPQFHELYRWITLATAWQETCWRQFVRVNGRITAIKSSVGSVGLMQVNEHVWRGFYNLEGLHRDIGYNARAGSEILLHYLRDHAIAKREQIATGSTDSLARATYAAYNGGPSQLRRYRQSNTRRSLRKIDALFWEKYQQVKAGEELKVASCYGGSPAGK